MHLPVAWNRDRSQCGVVVVRRLDAGGNRAGRHGVAASTVSGHLAALHAAGLLTRRRYRHTVVYQQSPLGAQLAQPRLT